MQTGTETSNPDLLLIQEFKNSRDVAVLGRLYEPYMGMVYGVCLKYLKDRDESQDMVMQLFEKLITTVPDHEIGNFKSWLYTTARNQCLMLLRSRKGKTFEELSPYIMESGVPEHQEDELELESNLVKLDKCLEALGEEQKQCVQLFFLQKQSYQEITDQTGFDFNKVKSHIQNGKRNLKICLENNG